MKKWKKMRRKEQRLLKDLPVKIDTSRVYYGLGWDKKKWPEIK